MSVRLTELLEHALDGEPDQAGEVEAVFRRADRLRRRRRRALLASGAALAAVLTAGGGLLAARLLPAGGGRPQAPPPAVRAGAVPSPSPSTAADPVLAVIAALVDGKLRIHPRPPERGDGWRQYAVVDQKGKPRGTVQVAVYAAAKDLCFPVLADPGACARPERAAGDLEYLRYDDESDADWQVHQTIAHRRTDGRTVVVMAAGERGSGKKTDGKKPDGKKTDGKKADGKKTDASPPLTGSLTQKLATDPDLLAAFGPHESCTGPSAGACPVFKVPVPAAG